MKLKNATYNFLKITFFTLLFYSCDEATTIKELDFHILVIGDESYNKDLLEANIKDFVKYIKVEECSDTIFFPKVKLTKLDKEKNISRDLLIKLSFINDKKQWAGTLTPSTLVNDYDEQIPKLKLPNFLYTQSNVDLSINDIIEKYKVDYNYSIYNSQDSESEQDLLNNSKSIINDITKEICSYKKQAYTILINNEVSNSEVEDLSVTGGDTSNTTPENCDAKSLSSTEDIRTELLKIIDVTKTDEERIKIANQIWSKYFTSNSYVAKYINETDKFPKQYGPHLGQGNIYFTQRLARYNSILNLSIIDVEYSNKVGEKNKISGLHIVECHKKNKK